MMVKKLISLLLLLCIIFSFNVYPASASGDITLVINGKTIETDVNPIIIDNRTMVPARAVFDSFGAEVLWNNTLRQVTIFTSSTIMVFTIGSKIAYIDGVSTPIDASPTIVNSRTLVPIRFIADNLGYDVSWDDATRTVYISNETTVTPDDTTPILETLSRINAAITNGAIDITVSLSSKIEPKTMQLSSPERLVFDFYNVNQTCANSNISFDSVSVKDIRWAKHDDYTRLVVETAEPTSFSIRYTSSACIITVPLTDDISSSSDAPSDTPENESTSSGIGDITINGSAPIVVIDAGHGGYDTGAIGYDEEGNAILKEKEINLTISKHVSNKLESVGVNVIMTRSSDVALGSTVMADLVARSEIANNAGADLFISIHNNAFTDPDATGTSVLYAGLENNGGYGISSKELAENILAPLAKATGLKNRGTVMSPEMVVLRKTAMPAALIECAFVTSHIDQKVLSDQNKLIDIADAIFEGIVISLKEMGKI